MKSINLFTYTRVPSSSATEYMNMLAGRDKKIYVRSHEYESVKTLVEVLLQDQVPIEWMEGFFFSFSIRQISKEFDLLKINPGKYALNIELKSEPVEEEDILKQLRQNRYYLSHAAREIRSFTFIASTKEFYEFKDDRCRKCQVHEVSECLGDFEEYLKEGIERIFEPRQFLISPLNTPDQFLQGHYFLTRQQQEIEESILKHIEDKRGDATIIGISGGAGTGKTLLLYDIVRKIARKDNPCCIIHSSTLRDGHGYLKDHWENVDIIPSYSLENEGLKKIEDCKYLFIDEADGIDITAIDKITEMVQEKGLTAIYSFDSDQWMVPEDRKEAVSAHLQKIEEYREYTLSEKIRTSTEIINFFRSMLNHHEGIRSYTDYSDIDVIYANNDEEALEIINLYEKELRYKYIANAFSAEEKYLSSDSLDTSNASYTMEQEFDNVLILMDDHFRYDEEGRLSGPVYANTETLFYKLMFQDVSKARSKLCVLVTGNYELFLQISSIKYTMLERYQYHTNEEEYHFSGKKISKLAKMVKTNMAELDEDECLAASDNVDIILGEVFGFDLNRKVVRNSIRYLRRIMKDNSSAVSFVKAASDFLAYLEEEDIR